jgi:putative transposase
MPAKFIEAYSPSKKEVIGSNSLRAYIGKAGRICWFQSELEYWVHVLLDADRSIATLNPHGIRINHPFEKRDTWLLDSVVRWKGGKSNIVEIKPHTELREDRTGKLAPEGWSELSEWSFEHGFEPAFYTDLDVKENILLVWNWHSIRPYIQLAHQIPNPGLEEKIALIVESLSEVKLHRVIAECPENDPQKVLTHAYNLIHRGVISSNIDSQYLTGSTLLRMSNGSSSDDFEAVSRNAEIDGRNPSPIFGLRSEALAIEPDDPSTWPPYPAVLIQDPDDRALFAKRQRIVRARLAEKERAIDIAKQYGVKPGEVGRLIGRCKKIGPDGNPLGYSGIVPGRQIVSRTNDPSKTGSTSGALGRVFDAYPEIEEKLVERFLGVDKKRTRKERRYKYKDAWKYFLRLCRNEGFTDSQWPFTSSRKGREAVRRFLKKLKKSDLKRFVRSRFGSEIAGLLQARGPKRKPPEIRPYAIVQIDGHNINSETSIEMELPDGTTVDLPAGRNLVLFAVDISNSAILGYAVIPYTQHSIDDLLDCVAAFVEPWKKKHFDEFEKCYLPGAGMPGEMFAECEWRACDVIQLDNALAHLSREVQERIIETLACVVQVGFPKTPISRQVVERTFGTMEERGFNRLESTTGEGPDDPRKATRPEAAAVRTQLRMEHCEALIDIQSKNHNRTPSKKLFGKSPLGYIEAWFRRMSPFIRRVPSEIQKDLPLYFRTVKGVTIQGNLEDGHTGYIEFKYSRFKNDRISDDGTLVKAKADIVYDSRDMRSIHVYAESGEYLGEAWAQDRWSLRKHGYRERVLAGRWMNQQIHADEIDDPIGAFRDEVERQAQHSKRARRRAADQRRRAKTESTDPKPKHTSRTTPEFSDGRGSRNWISLSRTTLR